MASYTSLRGNRTWAPMLAVFTLPAATKLVVGHFDKQSAALVHPTADACCTKLDGFHFWVLLSFIVKTFGPSVCLLAAWDCATSMLKVQAAASTKLGHSRSMSLRVPGFAGWYQDAHKANCPC